LGRVDHEAAEAHAAAAVAASREHRTVPWLARNLTFLAEARRRRGAPAPEVDELVEEATTIAGRIGAGAVLADLERYGLRT
jgi:hypothetical protein